MIQRILNSAAKLIVIAKKYDKVSPILKQLHWLPVKQRIEFKLLLQTYKAINDLGPRYLKELLTPHQPTRNLRSQDKMLLEVPRTNLITYGDRAFSVCAPKLWNSLPPHIKLSSSVDMFKRNLKTFLFSQAFTNWPWYYYCFYFHFILCSVYF